MALYKNINFLCDFYFRLILIFFLSVYQVMDVVEYETISHYVNSKSYPVSYTKVQKRILRKKAVNYKLEAGKLVRPSHGNCLLVIRCSELEDILKEIHDNTGHQCPRYSYNISKDRYYWPNMYKDIESYVNACIRFQKNESSLKAPTIPLKPLPIITNVWYRVGMDLTGPLIQSNGYEYILTIIDHLPSGLKPVHYTLKK